MVRLFSGKIVVCDLINRISTLCQTYQEVEEFGLFEFLDSPYSTYPFTRPQIVQSFSYPTMTGCSIYYVNPYMGQPSMSIASPVNNSAPSSSPPPSSASSSSNMSGDKGQATCMI